MNKFYVLNNSNDSTLYYKDRANDTRTISESKRFTDRRLADNYLSKRNLSERYHTVLVLDNAKVIKESVNASAIDDIKSSIEDCKDIIDTTHQLIEMYLEDDSLKEEIGMYDISGLADKLEKIKRYMAGITFTPSFDNSLGSVGVPETGINTGGDPIE